MSAARLQTPQNHVQRRIESGSVVNTCVLDLDPPWRAHGLLNVSIGLGVIDEPLPLGVESQRAARLDGDLGQIDQGAGPVTVDFVECEFLPRLHCFDEIRELRRRVRQVADFVRKVGNAGFEVLAEIAARAGEEGSGVGVLAVKDDFATVGIPKGNPPPG